MFTYMTTRGQCTWSRMAIRPLSFTLDREIRKRTANGLTNMFTDESFGIEMHSRNGIKGTLPSASVARLQVSQTEALATMLSRSFQNEPNFVYLIPDEQARLRSLRGFFQMVAIPASRLFGEICTTNQIDGASLWIRTGTGFTFERMIRNATRRMPLKLDLPALRRSINLGARVEKARHRLVRGPHWYLLALGVEPSIDRCALSGLLIEPVLSRADSDKIPCYVEIFDERAVCFYERLGFRVEGAGNIPHGGPSFWAMIRSPK